MSAQSEALLMNQMEEPKAPIGIFELPCGFLDTDGTLHTEVEVSEITGHEEDMMAARSIPHYKKMGTLIARCVKRIGTITDRGRISMITSDLTIGDRAFLIFAIRRVTLGDLLPFDSTCPKCEKSAAYSISLADLDVKKMADPKKRIYDITLPSKKMVRFHVMVGRDEENLAKKDMPDDSLSAALLARLEMLDGKPPTIGDLKSMSARDRNHLRSTFEEVEGGVDVSIDMTCRLCGHEWESEVDPGQAGFFFPSVAQKTSKKRSTS